MTDFNVELDEQEILRVYALRHLQSFDNLRGFGENDSGITEQGKIVIDDVIALIDQIGVDNIDMIMRGDLKRHRESFDQLIERISYEGETLTDERLNALYKCPLNDDDGEITEREHDLARFKAEKDYTIDGKQFKFNPENTGVFPFDPHYSSVYVDRKLRELVFPNNTTLRTFENIEERTRSFQEGLIEFLKHKPMNVLLIGSCSSLAFNREYAEHGTIGENQVDYEKGNLHFPLDHGELIVFGYSKRDLEKERTRLHLVQGNIKIMDYLNQLNGK